MEVFSGFLNPATGAVGTLTLVVLLILWGKLVPRATLEDLRSDKDAQIVAWKQAYERSEEAREVMRGQMIELLQMARTTTHVIESLPVSPNSGRRSHAELASEEDQF